MKRLICFLVIACLLLAGCAKAPAGAGTSADAAAEETRIRFTDDLGRELSIPRPERVVTLIASFADVWCLAGGAESLVGVTSAVWTYYDLPLREDVVDLGSTKALNLEALIGCQPELVLASCGTDRNVELEETFDKMGIPTQDRILVLCGGRNNGIVEGRKTTKEEVGRLMTQLQQPEKGGVA